MTDRDKFEAWAKTEYEVNDFGQILIGGDDSVEYDVSAQDCSEEMFDAWQAATEQSQKEIELLLNQQERLIALVDEKDARIAELEARLNVDFPLLVKLFDNIDELKASEKVLVEALGTAQDELTHLSHHTREDYARDCVNKIFNSIEQALANVRGEL